MNPIINQLMGNSNAIIDMFRMVKTAQDPNAMMQTLMQSNPQMQQVMTFIGQSGVNAKQLFYNLAKQKGKDPNIIINNLKNI